MRMLSIEVNGCNWFSRQAASAENIETADWKSSYPYYIMAINEIC